MIESRKTACAACPHANDVQDKDALCIHPLRMRRVSFGGSTGLCPRNVWPRHSTSSPKPTAKTVSLACIHRGHVRRSVQCPTCAGNIQVKVHACAKHDECTLSSRDVGVRKCDACPDITGATASQ